jgi:cell shape-determining protein MreC
MNYLLRSKPRGVGKRYKYLLIVFLIFAIGAGSFTLFGGVISTIFRPIWKGQNIMARGVETTLLWLQTKDALTRENFALKQLLDSREAELVSLRGIKARELSLLEILGRPEARSGILASVLVRPPVTPYDILVIDAGSSNGISVGNEVRMLEGAFLGTVTEVSRRTAKVKLFSSDGERVNAVLERNEVPVILMGQGGGNFRLTLPRDVEVEAGDRILSADVYSELLAVVGTVNMTPTDSFKNVVARGAANIFSIRYLLVKPQ